MRSLNESVFNNVVQGKKNTAHIQLESYRIDQHHLYIKTVLKTYLVSSKLVFMQCQIQKNVNNKIEKKNFLIFTIFIFIFIIIIIIVIIIIIKIIIFLSLNIILKKKELFVFICCLFLSLFSAFNF